MKKLTRRLFGKSLAAGVATGVGVPLATHATQAAQPTSPVWDWHKERARLNKAIKAYYVVRDEEEATGRLDTEEKTLANHRLMSAFGAVGAVNSRFVDECREHGFCPRCGSTQGEKCGCRS